MFQPLTGTIPEPLLPTWLWALPLPEKQTSMSRFLCRFRSVIDALTQSLVSGELVFPKPDGTMLREDIKLTAGHSSAGFGQRHRGPVVCVVPDGCSAEDLRHGVQPLIG